MARIFYSSFTSQFNDRGLDTIGNLPGASVLKILEIYEAKGL